MKKILCLLLALTLCLSLAACGGKETAEEDIPPVEVEAPETEAPTEALLTKEEMLANAVEIGIYEADFAENKLRAEATYIGNTYLVTGSIAAIEADHIDIYSKGGMGVVSVAMPKESIMELSNGQRVQVVGKVDSYTEEEMNMGYGFTQNVYNLQMSNGYLVADKFEISGLLRMYYVSLRDINGRVHSQAGDESAWQIGLDLTDDNVLTVEYSLEKEIPVDHVIGVDVTSVEFGGQQISNETRITVYAKVMGTDLVEAELISVDG